MVTPGQSHRFRALIVDDDEIVRRVLCRALSEQAFECDVSFDGDHALDLLLGAERYDLLVTDLRMPNRNGHALSLEAIRICPDLVIVVHTAVDQPHVIEDLLAQGVDDVVLKPANYMALAAQARGAVARRRRRSEPPPPAAATPGAWLAGCQR